MTRVLLDTDVCLDSIAGRNPWHVDANRIFHSSVEGETMIYVSGLSFSNLFYLLKKAHGAKRTISKLAAMRELVSISKVDETIVDQSFKSGWQDFEDALQFYSALAAGCNFLVTRNLSDFKNSNDLSILHPSDFVEQFLTDD